jgi:hypothetical protein
MKCSVGGIRRKLFLVVLAVVVAMPAIAHQKQVAMTTVSFNQRTGSIEVIHRFYTHDTEHAMSLISGRRVDIVMYQEVQKAFGEYVHRNFQLLDQDRNSLPLSVVGVEVDGHFIRVYQETAIPKKMAGLVVVNSSLLDLVPGQVNTVNVECGDQLTTLQFAGDVRVGGADIDYSACNDLKR